MVQQIDQDEDELDAAIVQMKEKRLRGIILPGRHHKTVEISLRNWIFHWSWLQVMRQTNISADEFSSIAIDDRKAAYEATKYLLQLGHRKIAFMASELEKLW